MQRKIFAIVAALALVGAAGFPVQAQEQVNPPEYRAGLTDAELRLVFNSDHPSALRLLDTLEMQATQGGPDCIIVISDGDRRAAPRGCKH